MLRPRREEGRHCDTTTPAQERAGGSAAAEAAEAGPKPCRMCWFARATCREGELVEGDVDRDTHLFNVGEITFVSSFKEAAPFSPGLVGSTPKKSPWPTNFWRDFLVRGRDGRGDGLGREGHRDR